MLKRPKSWTSSNHPSIQSTRLQEHWKCIKTMTNELHSAKWNSPINLCKISTFGHLRSTFSKTKYQCWLHSYSVWLSRCFFSIPWYANCFPHLAHAYGFCPVWVLMCVRRFCSCVKPFWHSLQAYGLTGRWILLCLSRYRCVWKDFPQSGHMNARISRCISLCREREDGRENLRSQDGHSIGFSPVCVRMW